MKDVSALWVNEWVVIGAVQLNFYEANDVGEHI